jgi:exonuclease SbcC
LQALTERRRDLYGEKDPDQEESRLKGIESECGKSFDEARIQRENKLQALKEIESRILHHQESLRSLCNRIDDSSREFQILLEEHGFTSEEEYLSGLLPPAAVAEMEAAEKVLNNNLISSRTLVEEKEREYTRQKELNLTEEPIGNLTVRAEQMKQVMADLQNQVYGKQQIVLDNSNKEETADRLREKIALQKREQIRWGKLNRLIGSGDGTKFRSFAQGLTLSLLLNYANTHLQKLTDRYFLTIRKDAPLEIQVIDNYRAGEVRVVQNLSGGESFLVSLALALGLSAMSSRNVRVDSLFLDEGFGTLDEDSLEVALSALAGMKQEGKLIGVISHVQTLKERIPVQIVVEKISGGSSRLSGPGCRRW